MDLTTKKPADGENVGVEDVMPLRSRVSWGAIFAGAVMALAVYLVLTLLGAAVGFTVANEPGNQTFSTAAGIWAIVTTVVALFVGGWVTSQCTAGENKLEAVVHGVIMWGVVLFMTLWLVTAGMTRGFSAMWGLASFTGQTAAESDQNWQAMARDAGVSQERIQEWQQEAQAAQQETSEAARNVESQEVISYATTATWYTLLGTILSMAAAIGGAFVGAGPSFQILGTTVLTRRTTAMHS